MKLSSQDFSHQGKIPSQLTCDGADSSPELHIADVPKEAKSLALIMDDPDAPNGTWDHWVVFNMPASTFAIQRGTEPQGIGGKNSWGRTGYGGPCPPSGIHRYYFRIYALGTMLPLRLGATKKEVLKAMEGSIIAQSELMGTYQRKSK